MEARQHLMQTAGVGGGEKIGSSKVQVFIVVAGTELDTVTVLPPVRAITNHVHFIYIIVHMMWYVVYSTYIYIIIACKKSEISLLQGTEQL